MFPGLAAARAAAVFLARPVCGVQEAEAILEDGYSHQDSADRCKQEPSLQPVDVWRQEWVVEADFSESEHNHPVCVGVEHGEARGHQKDGRLEVGEGQTKPCGRGHITTDFLSLCHCS